MLSNSSLMFSAPDRSMLRCWMPSASSGLECFSSTTTWVFTAVPARSNVDGGIWMSATMYRSAASSLDKYVSSRLSASPPRVISATIRPPSRRCLAALLTCSIAVLPPLP
ncbi:hypothetical protein D3C78_1527520 [compost metagenome]